MQLEPHRGHVVSPFSRGDIEDLFWLQATIAMQLVRSAAERITDDQIDELERLADEVAAAIEDQDVEALASAEFAFRRAVNLAAGRTKLAWFLLHATRYLPSRIYADDRQWGKVAMANHRQLIAALRRRDAAAAVQLTRDHLTTGTASHRAPRRAGPLDLIVSLRPAAPRGPSGCLPGGRVRR